MRDVAIASLSETMRNCHFAFCNQKKKNWNFNKYYFSGNGDFYNQYDELNIIFL